MFNVTSGCPYNDWTSVARASCDTADQFHYLRDENGTIGGVCAVPIWVEKGRCPVYNNKAKKLDTVVCPNRKCPGENYRSNEIHFGNYCRYPCNHESSTAMSTISLNEDNHVDLLPVVLGLLFVLYIVVNLATLAIVVYCRKRKSVQRRGEYELESATPRIRDENDKTSDESRQLVNGEIEKTNEVDTSKYRGNNKINMQLLEFNNDTNANSKHQTTEHKERQNGIFNNENQLNGTSMAAKNYSEDDD